MSDLNDIPDREGRQEIFSRVMPGRIENQDNNLINARQICLPRSRSGSGPVGGKDG